MMCPAAEGPSASGKLERSLLPMGKAQAFLGFFAKTA